MLLGKLTLPGKQDAPGAGHTAMSRLHILCPQHWLHALSQHHEPSSHCFHARAHLDIGIILETAVWKLLLLGSRPHISGCLSIKPDKSLPAQHATQMT